MNRKNLRVNKLQAPSGGFYGGAYTTLILIIV
jgi:hypothetical protein